MARNKTRPGVREIPASASLEIPWGLLLSDNRKEDRIPAKTTCGKCGNSWTALRVIRNKAWDRSKEGIVALAAREFGTPLPVYPHGTALRMLAELHRPARDRHDALAFAKLVGDALEGGLYSNDYHLDEITYRRAGVDIERPRLIVTVEPIGDVQLRAL